jgi:hypothetical protein
MLPPCAAAKLVAAIIYNASTVAHNHMTSNIQDSSSDVGTKVKVHDSSSSTSDAGSSNNN